MRSDIVVFLGPTLGPLEAQNYLDAIYLPPVGGGDLVRAVIDHGPAAIVLIDGVFAQSPAVRHKEILWALARGLRVYGAASIGALRAAELCTYGMVGHGLIYRWYRRTVLADDGDVTVPMMPIEYGSQALGDALVDIRVTLRKAEHQRIIDRTLRQALVQLARSMHFSSRNFKDLFQRYLSSDGEADMIEGLAAWVRSEHVSQKRRDAIDLLKHLASSKTSSDEIPPSSNFELTEAFSVDMHYCNLFDYILNVGA
ncbi:TfuA-like protein [Rhizobium leguminosarum]|uniref:TfuA-like protein n=1 Tax=Rhizobium leguminosarum TaxID=384 RepID=UPI00103974AA|nr:TfuA-like protein [Rhizobium leguminosarum]TBZ28942.1 hypothetical protein E0H44_36740 [Rhizobium leguminosarum bv. viciae]TCA03166.1 hypothetical protein E0H68_35080 [Rhizobium leguminosarum bv. viciae]TCA14530.1 hypothetical protein E0H67_35910 [Rhizobium leguminosarum bv. viciae]